MIKGSVNYAMGALDISLPVAQGDIGATVERLLVTLENITRARTAVCKLLEMVRDECSHPKTVQRSYTGELCQRCTTCGKEW